MAAFLIPFGLLLALAFWMSLDGVLQERRIIKARAARRQAALHRRSQQRTGGA